MDTIEFSIIICCYNPKIEQLKKTIISSYKQKGVVKEIIIADDCSKNDFKDEITKWINDNHIENVKYSFLKNNVGTVGNILKALDLCDGTYVKPISPGDYFFDENSLLTYKNTFETTGCDASFADAIYYWQDKIIKKRQYPQNRHIFKSKNYAKTYRLYNTFCLGATICCKRDIWIKGLNYYEGKDKYLEDYGIMNYLFFNKYKVVGIDLPLVWYEFGSGISTKTKMNQSLINDFSEIIRKYEIDFKDDHFPKKMRKKFEISMVESFFLRLIKYLFLFPGFLYFKVYRLLFMPKEYRFPIEKMDEITTLGDGNGL